MRGTRWLLLVAIAAILGGVGVTYRDRLKVLRESAPARPEPLPQGVDSAAFRYTYRITGPRGVTEIGAESFARYTETSRVDLKGVQVKAFNPEATTYDLVKSAAASFDEKQSRFYSEGEVEITLAVPVQGPPKGTLVGIKSSGVALDTNTGQAETDRPSSFTFPNGDGTSTGLYYAPMDREIILKKDAVLNVRPAGPNAKPMKIEASGMTYKEALAEIWIKPWGRLTRENMVLEGYDDVIRLGESAAGERYIRQIEANRANGSDAYPNRRLKYQAGSLFVDFTEDGAISKVSAATDAQVISTSDASETTVRGDHVEMAFNAAGSDSLLTKVNANGKAAVTAKPLPKEGRPMGETHVLRSDSLEMKMRADGKSVETVAAHAPGQLEFLPNQPAQRRRTLDGNNFLIAYGEDNAIESFRARDVKTMTEPNADERKRKRGVSRTASRELTALFDAKTGRLASIVQDGDFRYEEDDRRAAAAKATLDSAQEVIVLQTAARIWDSTGSTAADRIRLDQRTGDFTAEGGVNSSRAPDKKSGQGPGILSGDEPLQAQARAMTSTNQNRSIRYQGNAVMWQGANRIEGDTIDLDRQERSLVATGNVVTNLWEQPKPDAASAGRKQAPRSPVLTNVRAARMVYTDRDRLSHYTGGALLTRAGLRVKSGELRGFLAPAGSDAGLERAVADGGVEIVQASAGRTRTGTGDHAEYFAADQKVILRGARAKLVDSVKGTSEGLELTYYGNDDRLLIIGAPNDPVRSRISRK